MKNNENEIIINGININQLQEQRLAIREGATQMISDNIEIAKSLTHTLLKSQDETEIETLAEQAYNALHTVNLVSEVAGVSINLPYYSQSSNYDEDELFSCMLQNTENKKITHKNIGKLFSLFEDMEYQVAKWNASFC